MNAHEVLKYGDRFLQRALDGIPQERWLEGGVCGVWSVKDILAHLASYELWLHDVFGTFLGATEFPIFEALKRAAPDEFNDQQVSQRRGQTPAETLAEYNAGVARNAELARRISLDSFRQMGALPWYGEEYDLEDFIVYTFYGHKREHGAQINAFKDKLQSL